MSAQTFRSEFQDEDAKHDPATCEECDLDRADALALWAVRVLDLHARLTRNNPQAPYPNADGTFSVFSILGRFKDEDAARIAAADAIAASGELGDRCPRRPA